MPAKKKSAKKESSSVNIDKLFNKVNKLGEDIDTLQVDVRDMAIELLKVSKEHNEEQSLIERIKNRLGL